LEIWRLRDLGYSLDAIRAALAQVGVCVSKSTVHREACRPHLVHISSLGSPNLQTVQLAAPAQPNTHRAAYERSVGVDAGGPAATPPRTGQDIARDFMAGRITNPLILARKKP
jgi:hypothetical protein